MKPLLPLGMVLFVWLALPPVWSANGADLKKDNATVELFEDDDAAMIKNLNDLTGNSKASGEEKDVYSGKRSLRVAPVQRFGIFPSWKHQITENPKPGEYRYLRFAWKKVGGEGIMVQMHSRANWYRYVGGRNVVGWAASQVSEKSPNEWKVVTRDLFKDFGAMELTGFAFTPMDGTSGLYDHIYLGRTIADLDRSIWNDLDKEPFKKEIAADQLESLWKILAGGDDAKAYRAQRALAVAAKQSVPFFKDHLKPEEPSTRAKLIARLIKELDDERFLVREKATDALEAMGPAVIKAMEQAGNNDPSAEARIRIERILAKVGKGIPEKTGEELRVLRAIQILEHVGDREARLILESLAKSAADADANQAAKDALKRLKKP